MNERVSPSAASSLFKTEAEIAHLVGIGEKRWTATARVLEREGLPQRDPQFSNRRYWPAVRAFLDRRAGLRQDDIPAVPDGEENWNEEG